MAKDANKDLPTLKRAGIFTALSVLIGIAYYVYLTNVSFPPVLARIVPIVWLTSAIIGLTLGLRSFRAHVAQPGGLAVVAVGVLSALFAVIFSLAALMGD